MAVVTTHGSNEVKLGSVIHYKGRAYVCVEHTGCGNCALETSNVCGSVTCIWSNRNSEDPLRKRHQNVMFVLKK